MDKLFYFYHTEWTDTCTIDFNNKRINRKVQNDECGNFNIINNTFVINWDKWNGNDIFININNEYYHIKLIYDKTIKGNIAYIDLYNSNLLLNYFYQINDNKLYCLNNTCTDNNYIGLFEINDIYLFIYANNTIYKYIYLNNIYYNIILLTNYIQCCNDITSNFDLNNKNISKSNINLNNTTIKTNKFDTNNTINSNNINTNIKNIIKHKIEKFKKVEDIYYYINEDIYKYILIDKNKNKKYELIVPFNIPNKKNNIKRILILIEYNGFSLNETYSNYNNNTNIIENYLLTINNDIQNNINYIHLNNLNIFQIKNNALNIMNLIELINPDYIYDKSNSKEFNIYTGTILDTPFLSKIFNEVNKDIIDNNREYTYISSNYIQSIYQSIS